MITRPKYLERRGWLLNCTSTMFACSLHSVVLLCVALLFLEKGNTLPLLRVRIICVLPKSWRHKARKKKKLTIVLHDSAEQLLDWTGGGGRRSHRWPQGQKSQHTVGGGDLWPGPVSLQGTSCLIRCGCA